MIKLEGKKGSGNKVKEEIFSPRTRRLAIASKNYMRELTAVQDPFPLKNDDDREEYIWKIIQDVAKLKDEYQATFEDASNDSQIQMNLITFVRSLFFSYKLSNIFKHIGVVWTRKFSRQLNYQGKKSGWSMVWNYRISAFHGRYGFKSSMAYSRCSFCVW